MALKVMILSRKPLMKYWNEEGLEAQNSLCLIKSDVIKFDLLKRTFWKF